MSIHDFHSKLFAVEEESSLLGTLRKLSLVEDPRSMFDEEPLGDWIPWTDIGGAPGVGRA